MINLATARLHKRRKRRGDKTDNRRIEKRGLTEVAGQERSKIGETDCRSPPPLMPKLGLGLPY
jgi:hypothetical protein